VCGRPVIHDARPSLFIFAVLTAVLLSGFRDTAPDPRYRLALRARHPAPSLLISWMEMQNISPPLYSFQGAPSYALVGIKKQQTANKNEYTNVWYSCCHLLTPQTCSPHFSCVVQLYYLKIYLRYSHRLNAFLAT